MAIVKSPFSSIGLFASIQLHICRPSAQKHAYLRDLMIALLLYYKILQEFEATPLNIPRRRADLHLRSKGMLFP